MKNVFLAVLFTFCVLASCTDKKTQAHIDSIKQRSDSPNISNRLIEKFKPIIQGVWVRSDYIADVMKTKSPYKSQAKLWGVVDMDIEVKNIKGDSLFVGYSLNNHEGANFNVIFKPGQKVTSIKMNLPDYENKSNFYELGYNMTNVDTSLVLYHYNKKNIIIDSVKYRQVLKSQTNDDAAYGIEFITNKKLISGNYVLTDSTGHKQFIQFNDEGKVYSFYNFKAYVVLTDFVAGSANNIDQLIFDVYTNEQKNYTYKLIADTLNIYEIKSNTDSTILSYGKLKYKLVKQK